MRGSEKKVKSEQEHRWHFLHKTCNEEDSGSFTLLSCKLKQQQRNVQKKCAAHAKFLFCLLNPLLFFHCSCCLDRLALQDFIICLSKLKILLRASPLALPKSTYYLLFTMSLVGSSSSETQGQSFRSGEKGYLLPLGL